MCRRSFAAGDPNKNNLAEAVGNERMLRERSTRRRNAEYLLRSAANSLYLSESWLWRTSVRITRGWLKSSEEEARVRVDQYGVIQAAGK